MLRLNNKYETIFDPKKVVNKNSEINNVTSPICIPRRKPRKRLYQEGQYESLSPRTQSKTTCLNESFPPTGYTFRKNDGHVLFCKLEENEMKQKTVSELTQNYMSNLFSKGRQSNYPNGFAMEEIVVCLTKVC